jgi:hypothetical protein
MVTFFFLGALSVAFLPLKIYTGQFEIQKKSLKILGDTGTLVQICGCSASQLWVAIAPPPTNTYVLELAVGLWVLFAVCGLFLGCRKGWCRNRRLVEVRAAGIEIAARDSSSSSFMINPHHHSQTLTSWNSLLVCGCYSQFVDFSWVARKGWCRNRRLVEVRAAGIEIAARDLSSSSFMINPLPPKIVAACLCHCKVRTSAKEEKILLISFTWALLAGIDDHVLLFLQQSCRTNTTTTGTRGEGGG